MSRWIAFFLAVAPIAIGSGRAIGDPAALAEPGIPPRGQPAATRAAAPADLPDIYGPGAVLTAGNVFLKVTNNGVIGNPFLSLSSDPSGQWPGPSGVEYLRAIVLAVGAVDPTATDPSLRRRVSSGIEWRPPTLDPVHRILRTYEGQSGGKGLTNDDGDVFSNGALRIDEDFLDGHDNDGDGRIDEDYEALGQLMYSCVMRDDTPASMALVGTEAHVPLGLECRQRAWAYSMPELANFDVIEYTITNRSGHELDSLYIGFPADLDAGSYLVSAGYYMDDRDVSFFPNGEFAVPVPANDPRRLAGCSTQQVRLHGFSVVDNDGDEGRTPGVAIFLLFGHTTDALGIHGPKKVGFHMFRSYAAATPFSNGGAPSTDAQRFELMASREGIDPKTGFIRTSPTTAIGDYAAWNSIGPFLHVPDGGSVTATIGFGVTAGSFDVLRDYAEDYRAYDDSLMTLDVLLTTYPALEPAIRAQQAYNGVYERPRPGFAELTPNCRGCEFGIKLPKGSMPIFLQEPLCREDQLEVETKLVTDFQYTWFNMDCDFCTGLRGFYLRHWDSRSPPPAPSLNVAGGYNYSDNPERVAPAGDERITLAWDNLSESSPDPGTGWFDFRTYQIWRTEWHRPVGLSGPRDTDWQLLSELRVFDYADSNFRHDPVADTLVGHNVWVPNYTYPAGHPHCDPERSAEFPSRVLLNHGGCRDTATLNLCLRRGDLWDRQSGMVVRPDASVGCARDSTGRCIESRGKLLGTAVNVTKTRYGVGRYRFEDPEVKNGFAYLYSIIAGDSTEEGELFSRRSGVEPDVVVPQIATRPAGHVWVVPNPYRGQSGWDLGPNATDPTGTHVDFMGLPRGRWTIRIYTTAGDLVAELHDRDPLNQAVRGSGRPTLQQDTPDDGQARWDLVSRNGQDVVSGIYLFVVSSEKGQQRGRFVIVR